MFMKMVKSHKKPSHARTTARTYKTIVLEMIRKRLAGECYAINRIIKVDFFVRMVEMHAIHMIILWTPHADKKIHQKVLSLKSKSKTKDFAISIPRPRKQNHIMK